MDQIKVKLLLYGILSVFYTSVFLFGVLYPQFGILKGTVVCQDNENDEDEAAEDEAEDEEPRVIYKSYFIEKWKALKSD